MCVLATVSKKTIQTKIINSDRDILPWVQQHIEFVRGIYVILPSIQVIDILEVRLFIPLHCYVTSLLRHGKFQEHVQA